MDRMRPSEGCDGSSTLPGSTLTFLSNPELVEGALRNDNARQQSLFAPCTHSTQKAQRKMRKADI